MDGLPMVLGIMVDGFEQASASCQACPKMIEAISSLLMFCAHRSKASVQ